MNIRQAHAEDYDTIAGVWEASVRATHHFLRDHDIEALKPKIVREYLPALQVHVCLDQAGHIKGFVGTSSDKIEMLFIAPEARGNGMGKALVKLVKDAGCEYVDVNEQNPQALRFYERMGFRVFARSPLDGQGNPFPILHMKLNSDGGAKQTT